MGETQNDSENPRSGSGSSGSNPIPVIIQGEENVSNRQGSIPLVDVLINPSITQEQHEVSHTQRERNSDDPYTTTATTLIATTSLHEISSLTSIHANHGSTKNSLELEEIEPSDVNVEVYLRKTTSESGSLVGNGNTNTLPIENNDINNSVKFTRPSMGLRTSFEEDEEYVNECGHCQWKTYEVSPKLNLLPNRCHFFSKIMAIKTFQLIVINGWLLFQEINTISGFPVATLINEYHDLVYVAIGIFLLIQIYFRIYIVRKRHPFPYTTLIILTTILQTICVAIICGTTISMYDIRQKIVHEVALTILFVSGCLTFLPLTNSSKIDVTKPKAFGSATFATLIFSILIMFVVGIFEVGKIELDWEKLPETWIPVFLSSEFIIIVLILEIRFTIKGKRYKVTEKDWLFTAMLL